MKSGANEHSLPVNRRPSRGHPPFSDIPADQVEGAPVPSASSAVEPSSSQPQSQRGRKREAREEPQSSSLISDEELEVEEDVRFKTIADDDRELFKLVQSQVQRVCCIIMEIVLYAH